MKEYFEKMKIRWHALAAREKQAVAVGSMVVIFFLAYQCVWKPCLNHLDLLRHRIASEQKTLVWMQSADQVMQKSNHETVKTKPVSLVIFLSQMQKEINQAGLAPFLTQLKQSTNESIEMHFQKVEFDKLMVFLIAMVKEHPVSVSQFSVMASDMPGFVSADIVMGQV